MKNFNGDNNNNNNNNPRDDTDRPYVSRKEGERKLASIKDYVDAPKKIKVDIKKSKESLTTAGNSISNIRQTEKQQNLGNRNGKNNYGYFKR